MCDSHRPLWLTLTLLNWLVKGNLDRESHASSLSILVWFNVAVHGTMHITDLVLKVGFRKTSKFMPHWASWSEEFSITSRNLSGGFIGLLTAQLHFWPVNGGNVKCSRLLDKVTHHLMVIHSNVLTYMILLDVHIIDDNDTTPFVLLRSGQIDLLSFRCSVMAKSYER